MTRKRQAQPDCDQRVADAARQTLRPRLKRVRRVVSQIQKADHPSVGNIHRLRVSVREAVSSLDAFGPEAPRKHVRRLRSTLRALRKAAGSARRADVLTPLLTTRVSSTTPEIAAASGYLLARLDEQRRDGRDDLVTSIRQFDEREYRRRARRLMDAIDNSNAMRRAIASAAIASAMQRARAAAAQDLTDTDNLHELRIACKRLRYTCEAFETDAAQAGLGRTLAALREAQSRLGQFNDVCDAIEFVEQEIKAAREASAPTTLVTGLTWVRMGLIDERAALRAAFLIWWRRAQDSILEPAETDSASLGPDREPMRAASHAGERHA